MADSPGAAATLIEVAPNVLVWRDPTPGRAHPNAGVVIDEDAATVIDALPGPSAAKILHDQLERLGQRVRRVVVTSSHVEHVGGSSVFTMAGFYGSAVASENLDLPPNVRGNQLRLPEYAPEYDDEFTTRPISHTVDQAAYLSATAIAVPTAGQQALNLVVQVPHVNIVFAGAMCSFGETPLCFDGDPAGWADNLEQLFTLGQIIVPGHGDVGGHDEVRALQGYLRACVAAGGDAGAIGPGPWDDWSGREWDVVNVERAAMLAAGDFAPPPSMLRALGLG
ncbi:MAG: MBL fold metallo-hydrolase [Acidimicrobiales bacterium]|nr:MBL fold metallo-hydrolase [Acidimicrobiales bacterium]